MKVLWIVNIPFGPMMELVGLKGDNPSGSWLNAALNEFIGDPSIEVCVATTWKGSQFCYTTRNNVSYCILPGGPPARYNSQSSKNAKLWATLRDRFSPDVIHVWGTEFRHGYHAMCVMKEVPAIIYMQGLLDSIARYYVSGLSRKEQLLCRGLRELLTVNPIEKVRQQYEKRAKCESLMIARAKNVIVENDWCAAHCSAIAEDCQIFRSKLPVREEFYHCEWSLSRMQPFSIMCNTSGYPIKGLHMLIKALSLIVKKYPNVVLKIPGDSFTSAKGLLGKIRARMGYSRLIRYLINHYGLCGNVKFLGCVPTSQMFAQEMETANVFVMPSSIENHSSTLIEAMIVGVPCVASDVGGISELITHGKTGFLYRFEEYELLAHYVAQIFSDRELAAKIGPQAMTEMRRQRQSEGIKTEFLAFYEQVMKKKTRTTI